MLWEQSKRFNGPDFTDLFSLSFSVIVKCFSSVGKFSLITYWHYIHLSPLYSSVRALRCVECDSEESCASPNPKTTGCTGGKCYTYRTADREVDGGIFSIVKKGCYPEEQDSTSLRSRHCEPCDNHRLLTSYSTDSWICEHHCCDDHDECNHHLYTTPTCRESSMVDGS